MHLLEKSKMACVVHVIFLVDSAGLDCRLEAPGTTYVLFTALSQHLAQILAL